MGMQAQTRVKVLTRITEKSYVFDAAFLLDIEAEKADISIETHDGNNVELVLKQIVKNPNQQIAREHLKAQKFIENKTRDRLYLKNYILFNDARDNTGSIFKNEYIIKVPEWCHVKIKNKLGNLILDNIDKSITLELEYAKAEIRNCTSKVNLNISLGELLIQKGTISGSIQTENTRVKMESVTGDISGMSTFGTISVLLNGNPLVADMKTNYCETTIINKSEGSYSFDLFTNGGNINALDYAPLKTDAGEKLLIYPESEGTLPLIRIMATDNNINLY